MELLKSIVAKKEEMDLYQAILKSFFGESNEERLTKIKNVQAQINKNIDRTNKAMQMMLDGQLDSAEYREIKSRYDEANTTLLKQQASLEINKVDYIAKINKSFNLLKNVDRFYDEASIDIKQKLLCLIFPGKLIFENERVQTPKLNEIVSLIMLKNKELETIKKGSKKNFSLQSPEVSLQGFKPRVFPTLVGMLCSVKLPNEE
jgi:site-specific DNA recombinase